MKKLNPLLPAALVLALGASIAAPQAQAQPAEREGLGWFDDSERGWFDGRGDVFGEGRRGWLENREEREEFDRGYEQGRLDERRDRMRRGHGYREREREFGEWEHDGEEGWFD